MDHKKVHKMTEHFFGSPVRTNGHIVYRAAGPSITLSSTPSGYNAGSNKMRDLCRVLGKTKAELLRDFNSRERRDAGGESPKDFDARHSCKDFTDTQAALDTAALDIVAKKFTPETETNSARIRRERFERSQKRDERKLRKMYAQEAEARRQRELLKGSFKKILQISHDLLERDLDAAENWMAAYDHAEIHASADCSAALRMQGFKTKIVAGEYLRDGAERGWFYAVEVAGRSEEHTSEL